MMIDTDYAENAFQERSSEKKMIILKRILNCELTELQRQAFVDYHFGGKTIPQIAEERGVNKSTVCRTLRLAEKKVLRFTKYLE